MGTKSREVIWGGRIMGAEINAKHAREQAQKAARADAHAWSVRDGRLSRARAAVANDQSVPSGGLGWLEVKCSR
jgi:hypothetical protein